MKFNKEELDILDSYEKGEMKSIKGLEKEIQMAKKSAENYFNKDSRINIRISSTDLDMLKRLAVQEGLPYQTFISSLLHKFVSGRLS